MPLDFSSTALTENNARLVQATRGSWTEVMDGGFDFPDGLAAHFLLYCLLDGGQSGVAKVNDYYESAARRGRECEKCGKLAVTIGWILQNNGFAPRSAESIATELDYLPSVLRGWRILAPPKIPAEISPQYPIFSVPFQYILPSLDAHSIQGELAVRAVAYTKPYSGPDDDSESEGDSYEAIGHSPSGDTESDSESEEHDKAAFKAYSPEQGFWNDVELLVNNHDLIGGYWDMYCKEWKAEGLFRTIAPPPEQIPQNDQDSSWQEIVVQPEGGIEDIFANGFLGLTREQWESLAGDAPLISAKLQFIRKSFSRNLESMFMGEVDQVAQSTLPAELEIEVHREIVRGKFQAILADWEAERGVKIPALVKQVQDGLVNEVLGKVGQILSLPRDSFPDGDAIAAEYLEGKTSMRSFVVVHFRTWGARLFKRVEEMGDKFVNSYQNPRNDRVVLESLKVFRGTLTAANNLWLADFRAPFG
ncbi:hypothetical protein [Kitasatospora sp. MBT63]|uniref:hypothetical protein n=1 Tax=Kitasatospora sp. MBT63 TaxID=1444768 RepID=UPI0011EA6D28|nr:hypothetical protein [Kitasatospora sp. MBT63]